jgi:hypothetical protein
VFELLVTIWSLLLCGVPASVCIAVTWADCLSTPAATKSRPKLQQPKLSESHSCVKSVLSVKLCCCASRVPTSIGSARNVGRMVRMLRPVPLKPGLFHADFHGVCMSSAFHKPKKRPRSCAVADFTTMTSIPDFSCFSFEAPSSQFRLWILSPPLCARISLPPPPPIRRRARVLVHFVCFDCFSRLTPLPCRPFATVGSPHV